MIHVSKIMMENTIYDNMSIPSNFSAQRSPNGKPGLNLLANEGLEAEKSPL